jgi:hypothetical protein
MSATIAEAMHADLLGRAYSAESAAWEFAEAAGSLGFAWLAEPSRLGVVHGITLAALASTVLAVAVLALGGAKAIAAFERRRMASIGALREPSA